MADVADRNPPSQAFIGLGYVEKIAPFIDITPKRWLFIRPVGTLVFSGILRRSEILDSGPTFAGTSNPGSLLGMEYVSLPFNGLSSLLHLFQLAAIDTHGDNPNDGKNSVNRERECLKLVFHVFVRLF